MNNKLTEYLWVYNRDFIFYLWDLLPPLPLRFGKRNQINMFRETNLQASVDELDHNNLYRHPRPLSLNNQVLSIFTLQKKTVFIY